MEGGRFGRYELGPCIARGGMAQIHGAVARGPGGFARQVAVKRLHPHLAGRPELVAMFLDEARLAALLAHPHIVQVLDLGRDGDDYFLCMEYLAGEDLRAVLDRGRATGRPVPPGIVAYVGRCVADALDFAHALRGPDGRALPVVHGDVSPSNVVVTFLGEVKLVDFGVARTAGARRAEAAGTPSYQAPEQREGRQVDGRADLYSLGAVLHELLTGEKLFPRGAPRGRVPDPRELRPETPGPLARAVLRALEPEAARRFRTGQELREALDAALAQLPPPPPGRAACGAFLRGLFGEREAQARLGPVREPTRTGTEPLAGGGPPAAHDAIPLHPVGIAGLPGGLVRVAAEVPAALLRAGETLVAVPAGVASFALEWTRGRLVRLVIAVSAAAFLCGLAVRELHEAAGEGAIGLSRVTAAPRPLPAQAPVPHAAPSVQAPAHAKDHRRGATGHRGRMKDEG